MNSSDDRRPVSSRRRLLSTALAVLVLVALVAAAVFLLTRDGGGGDAGSGDKASLTDGQAHEVTVSELREFASSSRVPVYWAGEEADTRLEFTNTNGGEIYVRYLTGKAQAGDKEPLYLTVGTYPTDNAFKTLDDQKEDAGVLTEEAPGGGIVLHRKGELNAYLAYPGQDAVVEVYAPQEGKALRLITEGEIGVVR